MIERSIFTGTLGQTRADKQMTVDPEQHPSVQKSLQLATPDAEPGRCVPQKHHG